MDKTGVKQFIELFCRSYEQYCKRQEKGKLGYVVQIHFCI